MATLAIHMQQPLEAFRIVHHNADPGQIANLLLGGSLVKI